MDRMPTFLGFGLQVAEERPTADASVVPNNINKKGDVIVNCIRTDLVLRQMCPLDLSAVCGLEAASYPPAVVEGQAVIGRHLKHYPAGCHVAVSLMDDVARIVGYVLAAPGRMQHCPLELHSERVDTCNPLPQNHPKSPKITSKSPKITHNHPKSPLSLTVTRALTKPQQGSGQHRLVPNAG